MAFSHISQYEYKSTNYLFISTTNRLLLIPLTMNADNHDASEVSSPSCSDSLAYFLLEDQHTSSYTKALQILVQHCPRVTVATVLCDFEQAEQNAMQEVFPDTAIQGCLFHWKQALRRQFVKISEFHQDNTVKEDLQSIYGLAFIPEDAVLNTWEALKTQLYANPYWSM